MSKFVAGWYLIYTRPRHEKKISTQLAEMNINFLLPTRKVLRSWHDRKKFIDEPLFPSYIFVYLGDMQSYYRGMDLEGVLYYVRSGKEVARVHESVIDNIRLVTGGGDDIEVSGSYFQPGRQMLIKQGALTGLSCEIVRFNSEQKLLVRVDLLQRNILLRLPEEYLMVPG